MNKLVVDTNVFLDVILARQPMCEASASVLDYRRTPNTTFLCRHIPHLLSRIS